MERIRRTMNELETDAQKVLQMEAEAILDLIPRVPVLTSILTRQWI